MREECPCGRPAPYDACCGRFHRGAAEAPTAEDLMRSRYAAFARGEAGYLFRTWHPRTRPDDVAVEPGVVWTRLDVLDVVDGGPGDTTGQVAFEAHWRGPGGRSGVQAERSRFERRAGRWVYVDGMT